jgi:hypothetical protein
MLAKIPCRCNVYTDVSEDSAASLFRVEMSATQEGERYRYVKRTETGARTEPVEGKSSKNGQIFLKKMGAKGVKGGKI